MPQEPKKRHSRQRQGKRRHSISLGIPHGVACGNCTTLNMPHTICRKCGFYQGRQVLNLEKKKKEKNEESAGSET